MSLNDYVVDKIFKDHVEILDVSATILAEDAEIIKAFFKKGVSSEKNKKLLCVLMSSLSYADSSTFYETLNKWGQNLLNFKMYSSECQYVSFCTYALKDAVIIAFKGSSSIKDFFYNINTVLINSQEIKGRVHQGFYDLLMKNKTLNKISKIIENYPISTKVIFTGHSLGGALASLMTSYCQNKFGKDTASLYTFGSPRVGDQTFCDTISGSTRIVNDQDPVSLLPFPPRYRHLKDRILLGKSGIFHSYTLNAHKISAYYNFLLEET
jgi:triacylglycerol lipase